MGTRGQFMSDGGREVLVAKILQPPSDGRNVRKPKYAGLHAAAHGRRDLESGHIQGMSGAKRLDQCFLDCPEIIEQVTPVAPARHGQLGLFARPQYASDESIEITRRAAFFQVHPQPSLGGKGNQAMCVAVTDIKADGDRFPLDQPIRLSVMGSAEGKLPVPAGQLTTENGSERRAAQGKSASSTVVPKALPPQSFFLVEPSQGRCFTSRVRRQIDIQHRSTADFPERTPPTLGNRGSHFLSKFRTNPAAALKATVPQGKYPTPCGV